jgi:hypothetical protein
MADSTSTPATEPVHIIDCASKHEVQEGFVVITLTSAFSSFGMTMKVRVGAPFKEVKEAFGRCTQWNSEGLRYLYKGRLVTDEATPFLVSPQYEE